VRRALATEGTKHVQGHSQNPRRTQEGALPANRAFVVQFQGAAAGQAASLAGRVEHIISGRRMRFASWEELQCFIEQELAQLEKASARQPPEEAGEPGAAVRHRLQPRQPKEDEGMDTRYSGK